MTNYSRSVLKSNGLHCPKIRLKKFGFSLKIVPANIVQKLPSQRCFKPFFIASFNFSHKRRNVRFKGLRRVHTRLCSKNRTQGHTRRNRGISDGGGITTLGLFHMFRKPCVARYQNSIICRFGILVGCALEEHRKPAGQRCAYARRCSAGVAAPLGCAYICRKYINSPSRILLPKSKDRQEKPLSDVPHPCF